MSDKHWSVDGARAMMGRAENSFFAEVYSRGSLRLGLYEPRGTDPQEPHTQDEVYIVLSGSGTFLNGDEQHPFKPGDALFVSAGREHRFVEFTDDLSVWVIFYGAEGGEVSSSS